MASNREERRQMRVRGAGSHKTKDVDFGLSFGTPKLPPPPPVRRTPQQTVNNSTRQSTSSRQGSSPSDQRLRSSQLSRRTPLRNQRGSSKGSTPGSSKNNSVERPSLFDIPPDDSDGQGRSTKRRRIDPIPTIPEDAPLSSESLQPDSSKGSPKGATSPAIPETTQAEEPSTVAETISRAEKAPSVVTENNVGSGGLSSGVGAQQEQEPTANANEGVSPEAKPPDTAKKSPPRKRKKRKSVNLPPKKRKRSSGTSVEASHEAPHDSPAEVLGEVDPNIRENQAGDEEEQGPTTAEPQKRRGRKRKSIAQRPTNHKKRLSSSSQPSPQQERETAGDTTQIHEDGRENADRTQEGQGSSPSQPQRNAKQTKKRTPGKRGRPSSKGLADKPDTSREAEQDEPTRSKSPSTKPRKRHKRKSPQPENAEAENDRSSNKETIEVAVQRFANFSQLEAIPEEDEPENPDASSSRPKYPNRSGVNPADVLSQICRETLEKAVTSLNNGISQESNSTRRAEWTRKRKVVEAFGAELEHRLFGMSELLDSNFLLATKLRKEKKDVAALRNRLMEVRKERSDIALKTDEVRRKYSEEESVMMEHNSLNNALHDLQLFLDRGRVVNTENEDQSPTTGLEFLLRTVAQDVSSSAPGSHGGLLNQMRNFNAQLERTAALLDNQ